MFNELLARYQAEMVSICREIGLDPDISIPNPEYYADMIIEAIDSLKAIGTED